jgi:hypothetical protein
VIEEDVAHSTCSARWQSFSPKRILKPFCPHAYSVTVEREDRDDITGITGKCDSCPAVHD